MKNDRKAQAITTFIGSGTSIEGSIEFEQSLRIDGCVRGTISSANGTLVVGEGANIEADISVGHAIIMGSLQGNVDAARKIEIHAPSRIRGNIVSACISIDAGVQLNGQCATKAQHNADLDRKGSQKQEIIEEKGKG